MTARLNLLFLVIFYNLFPTRTGRTEWGAYMEIIKIDERLETGQTTRAKKKPQRQDAATWLMDIFYDTGVNENINYANLGNRNAAEWLILKYGMPKVENMARFACKVQGEPYAPTITTPFQLKEKLSSLIKFKLTQDARLNNQPKLWRKNSMPSPSAEPTIQLVRKLPAESFLPETKTLSSSTTGPL